MLRRNYKLQREPGRDGGCTSDHCAQGPERSGGPSTESSLRLGRGTPRGTKAWVITQGPPQDCFPQRNAHESAGHAARTAEGEAGSSEPMSPWGLPISLSPHLDACLGCTGWGMQAEGQAPLLRPLCLSTQPGGLEGAWREPGTRGQGGRPTSSASTAPPHTRGPRRLHLPQQGPGLPESKLPACSPFLSRGGECASVYVCVHPCESM